MRMEDIKGPIKRGRGRPRITDSLELLEFDKKLVEEYRKRTAFYDPKSPMYRNKTFNNQLWDEIAAAMKTRSSVIKDRMTHLRQRYTKERRYMEVQQQQSGTEVTSSWPLYDELAFLNEYIRHRASSPPPPVSRPKRQKRRAQSMIESNHNGQEESEVDDDDDEPEEEVSNAAPITNSNPNQSNISNNLSSSRVQLPPTVYNTSQNYSSNNNNNHNNNNMSTMSLAENSLKYKAFGDFLAYSLLDLDESRALPLVSKFTNELVQAMSQNK